MELGLFYLNLFLPQSVHTDASLPIPAVVKSVKNYSVDDLLLISMNWQRCITSLGRRTFFVHGLTNNVDYYFISTYVWLK